MPEAPTGISSIAKSIVRNTVFKASKKQQEQDKKDKQHEKTVLVKMLEEGLARRRALSVGGRPRLIPPELSVHRPM